MLTKEQCQRYTTVLKEELVMALGCTEPIAIAYAAATARSYLNAEPDRVKIKASGNIIKNVKSVVVPNTGGLRGIAAAAAAGIIAGKPEKKLEVIAEVSGEEQEEIRRFLEKTEIEVEFADSNKILDIMVTLYRSTSAVFVRITDTHTNIVEIRKDGVNIFKKEEPDTGENNVADTCDDRSFMSVEGIVDYAETVELSEVKEVLDRQISCNMAIAKEGLKGDYGANVGRTLLDTYGDTDVKIRAKAYAAAGSDARMNGCDLPVVINSGSGNQGITASVPVIIFAEDMKADAEKLYRALLVANLVTIHLKTGIGRLSAYCGAVSAGCGSAAGIAYLNGGGVKEVAHTIVNTVAVTSGIVCDGAKASCAAKIAAAVDSGILGYAMYHQGQQFYDGEGLVKKGVENTIQNISRLAQQGMAETDKEIIRIMVEE